MTRVWTILFCLLGYGHATIAASLLEPEGEKIEVWPTVPLIFASDVEEYKLVRDIFKDLHTGKQQPTVVKSILKQVDKMKGRATDRLWRTYNSGLIGHYDRLLEEQRILDPRLSFSYDGVKPSELPQEINLEAESLQQLGQKAGVSGVFAFVTYTKLSQKQMRATLTLVRLRDGVSKSFTVNDQSHKIAQRHAQLLFDYLYGPSFPQYQDPLEARRWLLPAPIDQGREVSQLQARLACRSQGGELPTIDELILGEQAGPYHNGIILKAGMFYHAADKRRYLAGETMDPRGKIRQLRSERQRARYYCIQDRPPAPQPVVAAPVEEEKEEPKPAPNPAAPSQPAAG